MGPQAGKHPNLVSHSKQFPAFLSQAENFPHSPPPPPRPAPVWSTHRQGQGLGLGLEWGSANSASLSKGPPKSGKTPPGHKINQLAAQKED